MPSRRIAHLSDLHVGEAGEESSERLVRAVLRSGADRVAITGDVTHRGRTAELTEFRRAFAPLLDSGRAVVVPGNHDRLGDDLEAELMPGERVQVSAGKGLWMVRCNSTGPHNRRWWDSHGLLRPADVQAVVEALDSAPAGSTRVLLLHHHLLPLPEEDLFERLVSRLGWPNAAELPLGLELLRRVRHRCDLVLHGHRHAPAELRPFACEAPLRVFNGGSSTELQAFRVFDVDGERVDTCWIDARAAEETANEPLRALSKAAA
jgi:3',5'-cyclic AMP phosphodiesterase CpdA